MSEREFNPGDNVHYIDEYPELHKKVWLRRLEQQRKVGQEIVHMTQIIPMPERPDPDGAT